MRGAWAAQRRPVFLYGSHPASVSLCAPHAEGSPSWPLLHWAKSPGPQVEFQSFTRPTHAECGGYGLARST